MATDMHGLRIGMRVLEDGQDVTILGTIMSIDERSWTAYVSWDNGHFGDADLDILIPDGGW